MKLPNLTFPDNSADWRRILGQNIVNLTELLDILKLPSSIASSESAKNYPLNVTRDFVSRMEIGNPDDPLLLQILPAQEELKIVSGFSCDPLDELNCAANFNLSSEAEKNEFFPR